MNAAAALPDILQRILAVKDREAADLAPRLGELRRQVRDLPPPRDFRAALAGPGLAVVAEIKKASPSVGSIAADLDPAALAGAYARGGAAAISVLTDREFFHGGPDDLRQARAAASIPILRKDFIVAEAQVYEARAMGADTLLLIAAALPPDRLAELLGLSRELGMEPLVEVHDEEELAMAVDAGAGIIGVNSRNLRSFVVDLAVAERLRPLFPAGLVSVAESGIRTPADARRLANAGFDAVLVGEALVRHGADGCAAFLQQLRET
jgi:indole-3-glycerol phosphate synthase